MIIMSALKIHNFTAKAFNASIFQFFCLFPKFLQVFLRFPCFIYDGIIFRNGGEFTGMAFKAFSGYFLEFVCWILCNLLEILVLGRKLSSNNNDLVHNEWKLKLWLFLWITVMYFLMRPHFWDLHSLGSFSH